MIEPFSPGQVVWYLLCFGLGTGTGFLLDEYRWRRQRRADAADRLRAAAEPLAAILAELAATLDMTTGKSRGAVVSARLEITAAVTRLADQLSPDDARIVRGLAERLFALDEYQGKDEACRRLAELRTEMRRIVPS